MPSLRLGQAATVVVVSLALTSAAFGPSAGHSKALRLGSAGPTTPHGLVAARPAGVDPPTPPTPAASLPPTAAAAPASATGPPVTQPPAPPAAPVNVGSVYAVGDSVMIDIKPELSRDIVGITVDGKVSRQFATGVQIISTLRSSGRLPSVVVVGLGTNGTVTPSLFDAMMAAAQGARRVVFCTVHVPRSWESGDNAVIRAGIARYPNTALADWHALSQGHAEWFAPDGFHVNAAGARAMAALIASVI